MPQIQQEQCGSAEYKQGGWRGQLLSRRLQYGIAPWPGYGAADKEKASVMKALA